MKTFVLILAGLLCQAGFAQQPDKKIETPDCIESCITVGADNLDQTAIQKTFRGNRNALIDCYAKYLKKDPVLQGTVQLTIGLNMGGYVTAVRIDSNTVADSLVGRCLQSRIKGWRFPNGDKRTVTVKLRFNQKVIDSIRRPDTEPGEI